MQLLIEISILLPFLHCTSHAMNIISFHTTFPGLISNFLLLIFVLHLHPLAPPGSSTDNVVHTQQQLSSLGSGADNGSLELVCLHDTEFGHVANLIFEQVQAGAGHAFADGLSEAGNEI